MDFELRFLLVCMRIPRTRQACATLTLQLHLDSTDWGIGEQLDDDLSSDEIEIGEMGVWPVEMDPCRRHVDQPQTQAASYLGTQIRPAVAPPRHALLRSRGSVKGV